jgi:hypothetical protein
MKKFMLLCLVCLFTLLSGQCLAYTVSGKVYQKGTTITVPNAFVNLNSSSGSSNQGTTDAFGSFSLGWAGANMINNTMTLSASKSPMSGQTVWTASQNTEYEDVDVVAKLELDPSLVVSTEPIQALGDPGGPVVNPAVIQATNGSVVVNNCQVNLFFNQAVMNPVDVTSTVPGASLDWILSGPGQLEVSMEFDPPFEADFPAESFFDVHFELDVPETDALVAVVTVDDAIFNLGGPDLSGRPSSTENLIGTPAECQPYFLIDSKDEWDAALDANWPQANIIPMSPAEWNHPEWGYMAQWELCPVEGEPYPPTTFLPAGLYVYEGDDDPAEEEPDDAGLVMRWNEEESAGDHASAWKYDFGLDPDLSNCIVTITAQPPSATAITTISLGLQDVNGNIRSWHWNVPGVIAYDVPTTITIDTTMTGLAAANPVASGYVNNPSFDLSKVQYIIADENSNWVGGPVPVPAPGQQISGIWNYWYNLSVTPKLPADGINSKWYVKWSRPPVEIGDGLIDGWDEVSIYDHQPDPIMADDWECSDERPITDVHWWGSFKGWTQPHLPPILPVAFHIGIWTDVPDVDPGDPGDWSHPGTLIWENVCDTSVWNFAGYDLDPRDGDPDQQENEACFQWAQFLSQDEWFRQAPMEDGTPNVYWLSIAAIYGPDVDYTGSDFYPWGWKTRPHQDPPPDDAVRIQQTDDGTWPPVIGSTLTMTDCDPVEWPDGISWDLAFELTTNEPKCPGLTADLNDDCIVNLIDFSIIASEWLWTSP